MSSCAVHDGLCYASELAGYIHCLDAQTGKLYWTHDTKANIWSSPSWADNKVYLGTDDGTVWVFAHGKEKKILAQNDMGSLRPGHPGRRPRRLVCDDGEQAVRDQEMSGEGEWRVARNTSGSVG